MLDAALFHASKGRRVFPCDPATKRPMITAWDELATTDEEVIRAWWGREPGALPGWALPPSVVVVDYDPRNGTAASLHGLELPETRVVKTGGGGYHFFYSVPPDRPVKNGALKSSPGYTDRVGVDVKTSGGLVILDGVTRADGGRYELVRDLPIAPCPEWLLVAKARGSETAGKVEAPVIWAVGGDTEATMTPAIVGMLAPRLVHKGARHEVARSIGGALAASGWSDDAISELVRQLPSTDPGARVTDALGAAARVRGGEPAPMFGTLERLGYAPAVVSAIRTMAGGPALAVALESGPTPAADVLRTDADPWGEVVRIDNLHAEIPPVPWLCELLCIAPGAPTIFAGYGGLGKTMLVQLFALCVASGRNLLTTMPTRSGRVIHFDYEQGKRLTRTRYQRLAVPLGLDPGEIAAALEFVPFPKPRLDTPGIEDALAARVEGYTLCVIDSLKAATPTLDENSSVMREPLDMLSRISERTGCVFVVIHHARKPSKESTGGNHEMRGNSAINDGAQTVVMLEKADHGFNISPGKIRDGRAFAPLGIEIADTKHERVSFDGLELRVIDAAKREGDSRAAAEFERAALITTFISTQPGEVFTGGPDALSRALGLPRDRVRTTLERLEREGVVRKFKNGAEWQWSAKR